MISLAPANDRSSYIIQFDFTDETGAAVVPNSATWTLTNGSNVINNRDTIAITPLASTVYVPLYGDDLAFTDGGTRVLVLEGTYLSSLTGQILPIKAGCFFSIFSISNRLFV